MSNGDCHICKRTKNTWKKPKHAHITVKFRLPFICADCFKFVDSYKRALHSDQIKRMALREAKKEAKEKRIQALDLSPDIINLYKKHGYLTHEILQYTFSMSAESAKAIMDMIENA